MNNNIKILNNYYHNNKNFKGRGRYNKYYINRGNYNRNLGGIVKVNFNNIYKKIRKKIMIIIIRNLKKKLNQKLKRVFMRDNK